MTETTATTGASAGQAEAATAGDSAIPEAAGPPGSLAGPPEPDRPAASLAGPAGEQTLPMPGTGRSTGGGGAGRPGSATGSASVPGSGSAPAGGAGSFGGSLSPRPAYTRPPGMAPPPDQLAEDAPADATVGVPASAVLSMPATGSFAGTAPVSAPPRATAPVSAPPRATGRAAAGGVTVRPIGAGGTGAAVGAAPVTERVRPRPAATPRGPRRARLGVKRIDPWSVMKFSFAVSLVMFIVVIVAASVLYLALDTMGVFESINSTIADLVDAGGGESGETLQISAQGVIGTAAVLGALNVLLFTSLATLGAFVYNVCADLVGGVEVTLAERD